MQIRIGKANIDIDVNVDAMSSDVMTYVVKYGLTQILNDAHSQVTEKIEPDPAVRGDQALELAQKKLDAMMAGEVRSIGHRGDAITAEAIRLATLTIKAAFRHAGIKCPDAKGLRARAEGYLAKHPELMDAARVNIETAKELAAGVEL